MRIQCSFHSQTDNRSFKTQCVETQPALTPKKDLRISEVNPEDSANTMWWNQFKKGRRDDQETGKDSERSGEKNSNLNVLGCCRIAEKQRSSEKQRETALSCLSVALNGETAG